MPILTLPRAWRTLSLCTFALAGGASAQAPALESILTIDTENVVMYVEDSFDASRIATVPGTTTANTTPWVQWVILGDIVAANGQPVRGTWAQHSRGFALRPVPTPRTAIADIVRNNLSQVVLEILKTDGSQTGTIVCVGLGGGSAVPGAPLGVTQDSFVIAGGSGAFFGARGTCGRSVVAAPNRVASITEDPSMRRINGGGRSRWVIQIIPMFRPEIVTTPAGPNVFHADFGVVNSDRPARQGETLIVFATGLGPILPSVNPGEPFLSSPYAIVTSPVEVIVDGRASPAINQIGVPGTTDIYRVDFQVPGETAAGLVPIQLSAAWIKGMPVRIPVR